MSPLYKSNMTNSNDLRLTIKENKENRQKKEVAESTIFLAEIQRANFASHFAERLFSEIQEFNNNLDADHEVGITHLAFGQSITFHVSYIGYYDPSVIIFHGHTNEGERVKLIQNISQISLILIALQRREPEQPKPKIGFIKE
jgi:hypothetical protein